jgi:adenine-specific DNA methylase
MEFSEATAAFSAPSRLFDLNGETNRVRKKQSSAIIAADVRRFSYLINTDEVFGTHN